MCGEDGGMNDQVVSGLDISFTTAFWSIAFKADNSSLLAPTKFVPRSL